MTKTVLTFQIGDLRCGLHENDVAEIVHAVSVTPLPGAPPIVEGVISVRGVLTPVLDLRPRLGVLPKAVSPTDHFILVRTTGRLVALHVDRADALIEVESASLVEAAPITRGNGVVTGVATLADGLVLIHEPARFLSEAEAASLERAIASVAP